MAPRHGWLDTPLGRVARFLGGLRLAVPVMALAVVAMIWGTYIDSTQGMKAAMRLVYGSWWFIGLNALVCVSLIFAVITRIPWRRKHTGFILTHAGLVVLIVGGFWSLLGRVEGRVALAEGQSSSVIEIDAHVLELVDPEARGLEVIASRSAEEHVTGMVSLGDVSVEIVDRWPNIREESFLADDGPDPLRAVRVSVGPAGAAGRGMWVAEAAKSGGPAFIGGMTVRVLGAGEAWSPPEAPAEAGSLYAFHVDGQSYPLGGVGEEAFPGWTIEQRRDFTSALVGSGGIAENPTGEPNPAVEVVISDGRGTEERHTAFERFPDMVMARTMGGDNESGAELRASGEGEETLVVYGEGPALRVGYVGPGGVVETLTHEGGLPWRFEVGPRSVTVLDRVERARMATRWVEAPMASERRPALVLRADGGEARPLAWKSTIPVGEPGGPLLRYGPRRAALPFTVHLDEFRRTNYPGTMTAKAYESDVTVTLPEGETEGLTISMNRPFGYGAWKVYQSGYVGDAVSIFSVMKDPGLATTYLGSTVMCVGIVVVFYSRSLSRGHPGVARRKE